MTSRKSLFSRRWFWGVVFAGFLVGEPVPVNAINVTLYTAPQNLTLVQGNSTISIWRLSLKAESASPTLTLTSIQLGMAGTLPFSDVGLFYFFRDANTNGVFDGGSDQSLKTFSAGSFISLSGFSTTLSNGVGNFFVVAGAVSSTATVGSYLQLSLFDATWFGTSGTEFVSGGLASPRITLFDAPDTVVGGGSNLASGSPQQGIRQPMVRLSLATNMDQTSLTSIRVSLEGSIPYYLVTAQLQRDGNGNGTWDASDVTLVSSAPFEGGNVAVLGGLVETLTTTSTQYFVSLIPQLTASVGASMGVVVPSNLFTVSNPDSPGAFSVSSASVTLADAPDNAFFVGRDMATGPWDQGSTNALLNLTAMTNWDAVTLVMMVVSLRGSISTDQVVLRLHRDGNGNGTWDGNDPTLATIVMFDSFRLGTFGGLAETLTVSPLSYFVTAGLSSTASVGASLGVEIFNVSTSVSSPDTSSLVLGSSSTVSVSDEPDLTNITSVEVSPVQITQGAREVILQLTFSTNEDVAVWSGLRVSLIGEPGIASLRLYRETNTLGGWQESDAAVGGDITLFSNFMNGTLSGFSETLTVSSKSYYLVISLKPDASVGQTFRFTLSGNSAWGIEHPDYVEGIPFGTRSIQVADRTIFYGVSGNLWNGGQPLSGVSLQVSGDTLTGASFSESYQFTLAAGGNYTITPFKAGLTFSPVSLSYTPLSGPQTNQDFIGTATITLTLHTITGTALDGSGQPLTNVSLAITGNNVQGLFTSTLGVFSVNLTSGGSYTLTPWKLGYLFSPVNRTYQNLGANQTGQDFIGTSTASPTLHVVSGMVSTSLGAPLSEVSLAVSGSSILSAVTTTDGLYNFTLNAGGSYVITPEKSGYTFVPVGLTYSNLSSSLSGQDFSGTFNSILTSTLVLQFSAVAPTLVVPGASVRMISVTAVASGTAVTLTTIRLTRLGTLDGSRVKMVQWVGENGVVLSQSSTFVGNALSLICAETIGFTPKTYEIRLSLDTASADGDTLGVRWEEAVISGNGSIVSNAPFSSGIMTIRIPVVAPTFYVVQGSVVNLAGSALSGVTMRVSGGMTLSAPTVSGFYSLTLTAGGTYQVTPYREGYVFTPGFLNYGSTINTDQSSQNYLGKSLSGPVVLSFLPATGNVGVSRSVVPKIYFSRRMETVGLTAAVLLRAVRDAKGVVVDRSVAFTLEVADQTVELHGFPLDYGTTYRMTVLSGAMAVDGEILFKETSAVFTTELEIGRITTVVDESQQVRIQLPANLGGETPRPQGGKTDVVVAGVTIRENPSKHLEIQGVAERLQSSATSSRTVDRLKVVPGLTREFLAVDQSGQTLDRVSFGQSVGLTMSYADLDTQGQGILTVEGRKIRAETLRVYWFNEDTKALVRVPGSGVDVRLKSVYAPLTHFSVYAVLGADDPDLSRAHAYPVPFDPNRNAVHTKIYFTNLSTTATIKIYTVAGELVKTLQETDGDGQTTWDAKNERGEAVASDVYLYVIESSSQRKTGKLVVIR